MSRTYRPTTHRMTEEQLMAGRRKKAGRQRQHRRNDPVYAPGSVEDEDEGEDVDASAAPDHDWAYEEEPSFDDYIDHDARPNYLDDYDYSFDDCGFAGSLLCKGPLS